MASFLKNGVTRGKRSKRSRPPAASAIGHEQPTAEELKAIAEGRRAYRRGEIVDMETYFAERARRASVPNAFKILKRAGVGNPPMKGDELRPRRKQRRIK